MVALAMRRLLLPSLAPTLTRPGILNVTWKPLTSTVACCSSANLRDSRGGRRRAPPPASRGAAPYPKRFRGERPRHLRILHDQRVQFGRAAAAGGPHRGDAEADIRPILAGVLGDLGAAHQFERGFSVLGAGVETGIVKRRPARIPDGIGDPQRRLGGGGGSQFDADLELVRRLDRAILFEPRDLAVDLALLALRPRGWRYRRWRLPRRPRRRPRAIR